MILYICICVCVSSHLLFLQSASLLSTILIISKILYDEISISLQLRKRLTLNKFKL